MSSSFIDSRLMRQKWLSARVGALVVFIMLAARAASAQTITTGVLDGVVADQNDVPLSEVLVLVTPVDGGAARSVVSARDGSFRLALIPAGLYQVSFERLGYRPVIVAGVRIGANTLVPLSARLTEAPPPVQEVERVQFGAAAAGSRAGASQLLSAFGVDDVPWERRAMAELPRFASSATRSFEVEGLPSWFNTVRVDGVPFRPARNPAVGVSAPLVLPLNAVTTAELVLGDADAEWGGAAGGTLSTITRRGGNAFNARAFGSWAGNSLRSSDLFDTADLSGSSVWGGIVMSGAIIPDTAQVAVGLEFNKLQRPFASLWSLDESTATALVSAASARGEELTAYTLPYSLESTSVTGFGRFDWQLAANNQLSVRAALGSVQPGSSGFELAAAGFPEATADARDLLVSAALTSVLGTNWAHEVRVGFSSSTRDFRDEDDVVLPTTTVVNGAFIGAAPGWSGEFSRSEVTIDQTLQIPFSKHQLKFGLGLGVGTHDQNFTSTGVGRFAFGGNSQFAQGEGVFVQTSSATPEVSFSTLGVNGFVQDSWSAAPGVQILLGARVDAEKLPADDIRQDAGWLQATGLDNAALEKSAISVSPRFGLTWDVGQRGKVMVRVNAGRYSSPIDQTILADLLAGDGDLTVRRSFGSLDTWPAAPPSTVAATTGTRLAVLGPDFRGPQSDRIALGLSSQLGALGTLHVSAVYRKTGFLPRHTDLNLVATPVAEDQYGRPLFGTLSQSGQLLTAAATNRRFRGYDVVDGITADGSAEYTGLTIGLERDAGNSLRIFGRYTYSQTTDNWPARAHRAEALLAPFPGALSDEWLEGTSDFDLPHRAVAGVELAPAVALQPRITAIYRFQSGYPFTPGFRDGVDANGDGSDSNDPAFIDTGLAGMSELISKSDCLGSQAGSFAERNSCRADNVHELDLRLALRLLDSGRTSARLFVEGINLMDAKLSEPDRAVVLVDAARALDADTDGVVNVPLVANPNFGEPLIQRGSGRLLRIGLQVIH